MIIILVECDSLHSYSALNEILNVRPWIRVKAQNSLYNNLLQIKAKQSKVFYGQKLPGEESTIALYVGSIIINYLQ